MLHYEYTTSIISLFNINYINYIDVLFNKTILVIFSHLLYTQYNILLIIVGIILLLALIGIILLTLKKKKKKKIFLQLSRNYKKSFFKIY